MPSRPHLVLAALSSAAALAGLLAGCSSDVTTPRVERSLGPTFANLYVQQQTLLGHTGLTAATVAPRPTCSRTNPAAHNKGAGTDWICQVSWTGPDHKPLKGKFELTIHPNGCYEAGGPTKVIGPVTIRAADGKDVTNPVFEFDGCFDTT